MASHRLRNDYIGKNIIIPSVWIDDVTISKCSVDRRDSIISKLIRHVVEPYVSKHKDDLSKGEKGTIDADPLIEAAIECFFTGTLMEKLLWKKHLFVAVLVFLYLLRSYNFLTI